MAAGRAKEKSGEGERAKIGQGRLSGFRMIRLNPVIGAESKKKKEKDRLNSIKHNASNEKIKG